MPLAGKVCFKDNPDNTSGAVFPINLCLSYGGAGFTGDTEGGFAANAASLSILGSQSLSRNALFDTFGFQRNSDFVLATPTPNSTLSDVDNAANAESTRWGKWSCRRQLRKETRGRIFSRRRPFWATAVPADRVISQPTISD